MDDWTDEEMIMEANRRMARREAGVCVDSGYGVAMCKARICDCWESPEYDDHGVWPGDDHE